MKEVSATEAARRFSEVLDAVEHRHETFLVRRAGKVVAHIGPASGSSGLAVKRFLRAHRPDEAWAAELRRLRSQLTVEDRNWTA